MNFLRRSQQSQEPRGNVYENDKDVRSASYRAKHFAVFFSEDEFHILIVCRNLNRGERAFIEAEECGWGIAEGTVPERMGPIMDEQIRKGVKFRLLIPEARFPTSASPSPPVKNLEMRGLLDLPAIVVLTEKEGAVCFRQVGGRVDYAGFFGKHPTFLNWVKDLFQYYWDRGKRV